MFALSSVRMEQRASAQVGLADATTEVSSCAACQLDRWDWALLSSALVDQHINAQVVNVGVTITAVFTAE